MKDVVKSSEITLWECPGSHRRSAGIMFERDITPTTNIAAGIVILPVGEEKPVASVHGGEEIYYVVRGKGKIVLGDRVVGVEKGTAVYVPPRVGHRFINTGDEEMELYWVIAAPADAFGPPGGFLQEIKGWKKVR